MAELLRKLACFGMAGAVTTGLTYLVFVAAMGTGLHYVLASVSAWASGLVLSYGLNKRFTFLRKSRANAAEATSFLGGYGLQLLLGTAGYAVLIGGLGLKPTPAFLINLVLTSGFSFLFMHLVVFRQPVPSGPGLDQLRE